MNHIESNVIDPLVRVDQKPFVPYRRTIPYVFRDHHSPAGGGG